MKLESIIPKIIFNALCEPGTKVVALHDLFGNKFGAKGGVFTVEKSVFPYIYIKELNDGWCPTVFRKFTKEEEL